MAGSVTHSHDGFVFYFSSFTCFVQCIIVAHENGRFRFELLGELSFICRRKVRTLYACEAENDSELSFEPNQIIINGKSFDRLRCLMSQLK